MNTGDFISRIAPGAVDAMKNKGILASLTIAQAALESGWGAHAPGNNLFGIKANGWGGATQLLATTEYVGGREITERDLFRAYGSFDESVCDHADFLAGNGRYKNIIGVADYREACRLIEADGYATEPDYSQQLTGIIEKYGLVRYDSLPALITIDEPSEGAAVNGGFTIRGWALSMSGVKRVDIYAEGNTGLISTGCFYVRPDVAAAVNPFGWYNNADKSGFCCEIPSGMLCNGSHTLNIAAVSEDGSAVWTSADLSVTVPPLICIDSPGDGACCSGDVTVSGWALCTAGVSRVDVYYDGNTGAASIGSFTERPDVDDIMNPYGRYAGALQSGFSCTIPAGTIPSGRHTLGCAAVGNDGSVVWGTREINIKSQCN